MTALTIYSRAIHQDENGLYRLNDLHRASGASESKRPGEWVRRTETQELIAEVLSDPSGNSRSTQSVNLRFEAIHSIRGGKAPGTYACEELAIAYAAWINPKFHLKVLRTFLDLHKQPPRDPQLTGSPLEIAKKAGWGIYDPETEAVVPKAKIKKIFETVMEHQTIANLSLSGLNLMANPESRE